MSAPLGGLPGFALRPLGGLIAFCIGFVVVFGAGFGVTQMIVDQACAPVSDLGQEGCGLMFTSPQALFWLTIRQSVLGGMILATPCLIFQLARVIAPTLSRVTPEKVVSFAVAGGILAVIAVWYALFQEGPRAFSTAMAYLDKTQSIVPGPSVHVDYARAVLGMAGGYALVLQVPVILIMIVKSMRLRRALQSEVEA